ncbi:unnamed protein product [Pleuronectes platessa]|uniref:Uncharacterized protein n=1 Tax=Pleuronectes platessa TaxID=8262 RepID=A0A9N7U4E2_PLEPL|nr:unnamed protein product [Pleuronectes platessa]
MCHGSSVCVVQSFAGRTQQPTGSEPAVAPQRCYSITAALVHPQESALSPFGTGVILGCVPPHPPPFPSSAEIWGHRCPSAVSPPPGPPPSPPPPTPVLSWCTGVNKGSGGT